MPLRRMRRLWPTALLLASSLALPRASAGAPSLQVPGFNLTAPVTGLSNPTGLAFLPDGRMLVTEKGGTLKLIANGATVTSTDIPVCTDSEMGLLDVAVDPGFAGNGYVYLYRTKAGPNGCGDSNGRTNQVVRVTLAGDAFAPDPPVELLTGIHTDGGNHDGGGLRIGPDGKLWVGVGDSGVGDNQGGPGSATNPYSQDLGELNGKILRLELDGSPAADNPFVGQQGARAEIFARGFRNPWRIGFDPATGKLWVGDVGDETIEEIDIATAGGNFGWPHCEARQPQGCENPGDVPPIFSYQHGGALGSCVTGGVFAGASFGTLADEYVFGDYTAGSSGRLFFAAPSATRNDLVGPPTMLVDDAGGPVDIVWGPDAALYYVAYGNGEVRRIAAACTSAPDCDDHDACTVDTCDQVDGCHHTPTADATPCDDGDPCTDDTCDAQSPGGCAHQDRTGFPGATCQFQSHALDDPTCQGQTMPRSVHDSFEAAGRQVVRAANARKPARAKRLLSRAIASLKKAATAASHAARRLAISNDCATATVADLTTLQARLQTLLGTL
jgi:glucose/arabinose dehydrogenase